MFIRVSATEENLSTLCYGGALLQTPPHKTLQQTYCTHPHTRHCIAARKTLQQTNRHCNRRIDTNAPQRIRRTETNAPQRMTMDILCRVSCVLRHVSCVLRHVSCVLRHVSCVLRHVSCVLRRVSCVLCVVWIFAIVARPATHSARCRERAGSSQTNASAGSSGTN